MHRSRNFVSLVPRRCREWGRRTFWSKLVGDRLWREADIRRSAGVEGATIGRSQGRAVCCRSRRRTSTRLARSAIAFHGRLRSGGGFCFFTGHDTRADPFNFAFAQHGERMHIWDDGSSSDLAFRQKARRVASRRAPSASLTFRIMKSNRRGRSARPRPMRHRQVIAIGQPLEPVAPLIGAGEKT